MSAPVWVFNETDSVYAWPEPFATEAAAERFIEEFRRRYAAQGYYLTADGMRIAPDAVELLIVPE